MARRRDGWFGESDDAPDRAGSVLVCRGRRPLLPDQGRVALFRPQAGDGPRDTAVPGAGCSVQRPGGAGGGRPSCCRLTPDDRTGSLVWLAFLPRATCREDFRVAQNREQTEWRGFLAAFMRDAAQHGELDRHIDCQLEPVLLATFLDDLVVQALLEPGDYTPARQVQLIGAYLEGRGLGLLKRGGPGGLEPATGRS